MTPADRLGLTLILAVGIYVWIAYPYQLASAILTLAVLGMMTLAVKALLSGAKRLGAEMKKRARQPGTAPRSPTTHSTMKVIR